MFASNSLGKKLLKTKNQKSNNRIEVPFVWPADGLWSGWEAVQEKNRTVFSAFRWKMNGNFIRFRDIDWDDDKPVIKY